MKATPILLLLLSVSFLTATLKAQLPHLIFHAELNGVEQIPSVNTEGKGLITLLYSPDRTKVTVSGLLVNLPGDVTALTLHIGKTGEEGAVLLDLMPIVHGRELFGDVEVPQALLQNLLPDRAYASLSTTAYPDGAIRGQFICETDLDFRGVLTGSEAVPGNSSAAFGFGGVHFPTGSEDIVYAFLLKDLSSPITEIGIYEGAPGQNGPLVHLMPGFAGGFVQGLIELGDLPTDFLRHAREGQYYVAVKTELFPEGEIRGQIGFLGYFTSFSPANAAQNVPSQGASPGFAFSHNVLNPTIDSLTTTVFVNGINPVTVDIRMADPGVNGPIFETLDPTATPGIFRKTYPLDAQRLTDFAQGRLYVSVTTLARPNGEIRGQMKNSLRKGYAFDLCGEQVVPPTQTSAFGVGMASVDQANCYLHYKVIYDRLSGPATAAYICQAFPTLNGSAIYPMPVTQPIIPGDQEIMATHGVAIELGETYVIIQTDTFPDGEIRGQIGRGLRCPAQSGLSEQQPDVRKVTVSPMPFKDVLQVSFDSQAAFDAHIVLYDMLGVRTLAFPVHIVPGNQALSIPTEALNGGYYTMVLENDNAGSVLLLKKLIRQY
ncbi:MAG: hypothetical protein RIQ78_207 [Bacteroidota bacterium]|jgi:hypothetical protein